MKLKPILGAAALLLSGLSFASDQPQLPDVFEVHFSITGADGKTNNASAVVIEGAKARMQLVDAADNSNALRLQFSIASDGATSRKIGRDVGLVDLSVSKQQQGRWEEFGQPAFSVVLGSEKAARLSLSNNAKDRLEVTARVFKVDSNQYADRIALSLGNPANCDRNQAAPELSQSANASPAAVPDKCCCTVACPEGPTWTCCNVLSCNCGSSTCSPAGGWLCY